MAVYTQYSPDDVTILVNMKPVVGWESVSVEMSGDKRSMQIGVDGSGRHIKNLDTSGSITLELIDYSPSNLDLFVFDKLDVPAIISIVDKSSKGTCFVSDSCMLAKTPALKRSKEGGTTEWVFNFVSGLITLSGARSA